jgi:hypothetical protein
VEIDVTPLTEKSNGGIGYLYIAPEQVEITSALSENLKWWIANRLKGLTQ